MLGPRAESQHPAAIVVCKHRGMNLTGRIQNEAMANATIPTSRATGAGVTLSPLQACRVPDGLLLIDKSIGQRAAVLPQSSWVEQTSFHQAKKYPNMQGHSTSQVPDPCSNSMQQLYLQVPSLLLEEPVLPTTCQF